MRKIAKFLSAPETYKLSNSSSKSVQVRIRKRADSKFAYIRAVRLHCARRSDQHARIARRASRRGRLSKSHCVRADERCAKQQLVEQRVNAALFELVERHGADIAQWRVSERMGGSAVAGASAGTRIECSRRVTVKEAVAPDERGEMSPP